VGGANCFKLARQQHFEDGEEAALLQTGAVSHHRAIRPDELQHA
jgi:hypothetical protein